MECTLSGVDATVLTISLFNYCTILLSNIDHRVNLFRDALAAAMLNNAPHFKLGLELVSFSPEKKQRMCCVIEDGDLSISKMIAVSFGAGL